MWTVSAPSNIALIKYMGKKDGNIPTNISLSYTLSKFTTEITMESTDIEDIFINDISLTENEIKRFLNHLKYIKQLSRFSGHFAIKSKNNFQRSAGIASSASSFAALTMCAFKSICAIKNMPMPSTEYMSAVSRRASGSSCRSFFAPWCVWDSNGARKINVMSCEVLHDLIMVSDSIKEISSSDAHKFIQTSLLAKNRAERANNRFEKLVCALSNNDWRESYQICWEEFSDMHAMFETSEPHFGYINYKTTYILSKIRTFWKNHGDGPIATIDAGPNVHLLWRAKCSEIRKLFSKELMSNAFFDMKIIGDSAEP